MADAEGAILRRPTEEVVKLEWLKELKGRKHYIGYEVSGLLHLGTYSTLLKVRDLKEAGFDVHVFLADYHSMINRKLGGDVELIREVAEGYFARMVRRVVDAKVVLASEVYGKDYWEKVLRIGGMVTVSRVKRTITIMGREAGDSIPASFLIYPLMQAADIFQLEVDVAQAGMDQRKAHMLALEVGEKMGWKRVMYIHTHLIPSLAGPGEKMSKSKPSSAVFVHDSEEEIREKLRKAYCPAGVVEGNPVIDILLHVLHREDSERIRIERPAKFGGDWEGSVGEFLSAFSAKEIHPLDVKAYVAERLIELLKPFRELSGEEQELVEKLKGKVSR